jgi:hypothetical protein
LSDSSVVASSEQLRFSLFRDSFSGELDAEFSDAPSSLLRSFDCDDELLFASK